MVTLKISHNGPEIVAFLDEVAGKRIPFARIWALTQTAKAVKDRIRDEMVATIDRPRYWTLNSLRAVPATKARPVASVNYREFSPKGTPAGKYLRPLEEGGQRRHKRWERALILRGIMSASQYAVPARGLPLDGLGNVPQETIVRILSQLGAFAEGGYRANLSTDKKKRRRAIRRAREQVFAVSQPRGRLPMGIYSRDAHTGGIRMMFAFVSRAQYRRQFKFYDVAKAAALMHFPRFLAEGLDRYPSRR